VLAKQDKAVDRRFIEDVVNAGNLEAAGELIAPDHATHGSMAPDVPPGPESIKRLIGMYRSASPDIRFHTGEVFTADGRVAHRQEGRGLGRRDQPRRGRQDLRVLDGLGLSEPDGVTSAL
jgi:hypothetical protein